MKAAQNVEVFARVAVIEGVRALAFPFSAATPRW